MTAQKISFMPNYMRYLVLMFILAGSLLTPASHFAYAHTFSTSESAEFLSLVDQIRAEAQLVTMNLENNNATLAQAHAEKASSLLNNSTLDEIREVNNRIGDSLETGLEQLEENVTSLALVMQGQQVSQDRIQTINDTVTSLNDILAEAVTVRVESEQLNNATTWAMVLADLTNVVLSNYGNATGAAFDLTDMANLAEMEGQGANITSEGINNNTTLGNATASNVTTNTIIVDEAAYQTAQYLAGNTMLQLFNDMLKPLTTTSAGANSTTGNNSDNSTTVQQLDNDTLSTSDNNATAGIEELEMSLLQLRDYVNSKASPREVMAIPHLEIHPMLIQLYGLTPEDEEGEDHLD
ncbi:MAG: hypothetical protein M3275_05595 [Thermoproteota archaeon]|nr:hypothetical protein [Thermoproteota archaeon]